MDEELAARVARASNEELLEGVESLCAIEHAALTRFVVAIGEIEARGLHTERAYASLFDFCLQASACSEAEAGRRVDAARTLRAHPELLSALQSREVSLTNVSAIRKYVNDENCLALAKEVGTNRNAEVAKILARWFPKADSRSVIRKMARQAGPQQPIHQLALLDDQREDTTLSLRTSRPKRGVEPRSEGRYHVHFTADEDMFQHLEHARRLTKHRNPKGDLEPLMKRALRLLHEELEKERLGKSRRATTKRVRKNVTTITRAMKRAVLARDGEQCTYVDPSSDKRCKSRELLEIDHITPQAMGGATEVANLRILCRDHNRFVAEQRFGKEFIAKKIAESRESRRRDEIDAPIEGTK
jgi:5-methylcytosine-specific restriction endonuclease McrA